MSAKRAPEASVILVVENRDLVRIVAVKMLESDGYAVVEPTLGHVVEETLEQRAGGNSGNGKDSHGRAPLG